LIFSFRIKGKFIAEQLNSPGTASDLKDYLAILEKKYNKGKALGILTHKLGRAIYYMLKNNEAFSMKRCFKQ